MKKEINLFYALLGNAVEFYDFIIYAFLATTMAKVFFPEQSPLLGLLAVYGVHFGGYLMRPLGSLLVGHIGDKRGRKEGLSFSILYTGVCTALIGLLPGYSQAGIWATILLVLLRLFQGLFVSGEQGGAVVYLTEIFGNNKKGLIGGLVLSSVFSGILLGSFVVYLISSQLTESDMLRWGWRVPFILALPLSLFCWQGRRRAPESKEFIRCRASRPREVRRPAAELFAEHRKSLVGMISIIGIYSVMTSLYMVFLPNYLKSLNHLPADEITRSTTLGILAMSAMLPIFGYIADRVSPKILLSVGILLAVLLYPIGLHYITSDVLYLAGHLYFVVVILLVSAPIFVLTTEFFPTAVKYSGTSFVFNTSIAIFSGLTPMVCNSILMTSGKVDNTLYWVSGIGVFSLLGVMSLSRSYEHMVQLRRKHNCATI